MDSINNINLYGIEITKFHIEINSIKGKEENINPNKIISNNCNNTNNNNKKDKQKNQKSTNNYIPNVTQNNISNKFRNKNVPKSDVHVHDLKLYNNDFIEEHMLDNLNMECIP